jgi:Leucine-rich repeat (LRR) protein/GTPase SAR1 family protein
MAKDKAYLEAEKKIQEALQSGATELDLSNDYDTPDEKKLTELPDSIGKLKQLRSLKLSYNKLTTLPGSLLSQLTQLTELDLSSNQLTTLPDSLGKLTRLTELDLSSNQLTALPDSLGQLTQLTNLNLSRNQLTTLPNSLGQLTQLQTLDLSDNQLTTLPDSLGQLTQLRSLSLYHNKFKLLPEILKHLTQLQSLDLRRNNLSELPQWFRRFTALRSLELSFIDWMNELPDIILSLSLLETLYLQSVGLKSLPSTIAKFSHLKYLCVFGNPLTTLPDEIGLLSNLETLDLRDTSITDIPSSLSNASKLVSLYLPESINPVLQSAYDQGLPAVKAYLRSLEQNAEPLYEAKLVLVGEGNVGKTTLLKALKGKEGAAPQEHEPTTHGVEIDIHGLRLPHPAKDGVEIRLNAWDFGGQDVYRVTHQFFFSRRSLYLLVWEPRRGVQQCQVEDWLNMIRLRVGDDARVIIISTYSTSGEHLARIDKPVFKQQYGDMIVGFHEVDSLVPDETTGEMVGIAELKKVIAEQAAKLEQMGMGFNRDWKAARDELLARPEPRISYGTFSGICAAHGLSQIDTDTLAHLMHDLGYIVHYSDDEKLRDDVVLKPEWLTKAIGFVLEDRATQNAEGILPDARLTQVWRDHPFQNEPRYDPFLYPFFLRLMEKYDVSYRLPEGRASLVAQHVPQVRPELPWLPEQDPPAELRRIAMICSMEEDPPGLVPWMIVRTHDYAVEQGDHHLHWQKGMFLRHAPHGEAMLEKRGREFHVYAQADWPEYFMTVIQHTLQKLITDNWPGMEDRYGFMVPCPEVVNGQPCKGRFKIQALRQFLVEGDTTVRCQECSCKLSIVELLFGFEERDMSVQLREIKEQVDLAREQIAGLESRIANYFMATMRAIADEAKNGPRLFTLQSRESGLSPKQILSRPMELRLWCEAEACQHPVYEDNKGVYGIDQPHEWVVKAASYAKFVVGVLKTVAPMAAPAINTFFGPKTTETWKIEAQLDLAKEVIDKLPEEFKTHDHALAPGELLSEPERSGILALHNLLKEIDPSQANLGLHRIPTYTGDYRWLCTYHYKAWQPKIPDEV